MAGVVVVAGEKGVEHPALKRVTVARLAHGSLRLAASGAKGGGRGVEKVNVENSIPLSTISVRVVRHDASQDGHNDMGSSVCVRGNSAEVQSTVQDGTQSAWTLTDKGGEAAREAGIIRAENETEKVARAARLDRFETALQKRVQQYYEQKSRAEAIEAAEAAEAHAAATHRHNYYTSVQHRLRKRPTTAPSGSDTQRQPWGRRSVQLPPTSTTMTQDDAVDVSVLRASFTSMSGATDTRGTRGTRKATSDSPVVVRAAAKALADANRAGEALLRHRSARLSSSSSDVPRREKMENQVSVKVVKATSPSAGTTAAIGTSILSERQDLIVEANERKRRPAKKAPLPPAASVRHAQPAFTSRSAAPPPSSSSPTPMRKPAEPRRTSGNAASAREKATKASNKYRTNVLTQLADRLEELQGEIPRICPCDNDRSPLDPCYTDYCARNCPLYRNPLQYKVALRHAVHMMGLD